MSVFAPLEVPYIRENEVCKDIKLPDDQEEKYAEVLAHFDKADYKLPGEEKGELMDEEKMWLVSNWSSDFLETFPNVLP